MLNRLEARSFPANLTQKCGDVVISYVKSAGGQRFWEGPTSNQPNVPGESAKKNKHSRIGGPRLGWLAEVWMVGEVWRSLGLDVWSSKVGSLDVWMFGGLELRKDLL